jgi:hypothetical protein
MPEGAVYVGRGSKWGNPYAVGSYIRTGPFAGVTVESNKHAVELYKTWALEALNGNALPRKDGSIPTASEVRKNLERLRGNDLVCWCALDQPCHADILLELSNAN